MRWAAIVLGGTLALGLATGGRSASVTGGWVEGWASGIILNEVSVGGTGSCDSSHECEVTGQGSGEAKTVFKQGSLGKFDFTSDYFDDLTTSSSNATGGLCHPVGGTVTLNNGNGSLVLDIEGQHCAVGGDFSLSVITAAYVIDGNASGGSYAGAAGTGAFSWSTQVGSSGSNVILSFSGNLRFAQ